LWGWIAVDRVHEIELEELGHCANHRHNLFAFKYLWEVLLIQFCHVLLELGFDVLCGFTPTKIKHLLLRGGGGRWFLLLLCFFHLLHFLQSAEVGFVVEILFLLT
jgi:hypothetical protein